MFDTQVDKLENISLDGSDKSSSGDEDYEEELSDLTPPCLKPATNLALKYGFVTDLTSLVVEENENYLIKIHDPEKLKYDITYQVDEYSGVSLPLETPSNLNFQEIERKIAELGKKRFF